MKILPATPIKTFWFPEDQNYCSETITTYKDAKLYKAPYIETFESGSIFYMSKFSNVPNRGTLIAILDPILTPT